jgi:hypothetical protein
VFSLLVCDTQMAWCTSARKHLSALLARMLLASAKPNREWSVNMTFRGPGAGVCGAEGLRG